MKTLTKTLGIIGMMTILGTGTMFGSTTVKDKNHKNGCVVVVNHKFDKNHKGKKNEFNSKCNCKTCMELMKKMNEQKSKNNTMNSGNKDMKGGQMTSNHKNDKVQVNNNSGNKNMNNNNNVINGRR